MFVKAWSHFSGEFIFATFLYKIEQIILHKYLNRFVSKLGLSGLEVSTPTQPLAMMTTDKGLVLQNE